MTKTNTPTHHISGPDLVPPAPAVMTYLLNQYRRTRGDTGLSFRAYLRLLGFVDPAKHTRGMDDDAHLRGTDAGAELIRLPTHVVAGKVHVKVLLVDFSDRVGELPIEHYEDLLFSRGLYPTGSMADFYDEVSGGKVEVSGQVHGWLRLPWRYRDYVRTHSGVSERDYPHNAQRMAEHAVEAALAAGVDFPPQLSLGGDGTVTALFIIHAGEDAARLRPPAQQREMWSHKWNLGGPIEVGEGLWASTYLTVAQHCDVGVCAHELGHLAFQWQDFYDPNYGEDGDHWDGNGRWDLMAGGSYNGGGEQPAHPAALHKLNHEWVEVEHVAESRELVLPPIVEGRRIAKIVGPGYDAPHQYLLLENRRRFGFDGDLPGEGLLVWRIDEREEMTTSARPGMLLLQADGRHDLFNARDYAQGDAGDPFPGATRKHSLGPQGRVSTSFPDRPSGVWLHDICVDEESGAVRLRVEIAAQ